MPEYFPQELTDYDFLAKTRALVRFLVDHSGHELHFVDEHQRLDMRDMLACEDEDDLDWKSFREETQTAPPCPAPRGRDD